MGEPKWTPGPWATYQTADGTWVIYSTVTDGREMVGRVDPSAYETTAEANAHVQAAAPDLYEALENLLYAVQRGYEDPGFQCVNAAKVLAKARGEATDG